MVRVVLCLLFFLFHRIQSQDLTPQGVCVQRCIANCLNRNPGGSDFNSCQDSCLSFEDLSCPDDVCWDTCNSFGPSTKPNTPTAITVDKNVTNSVYWTPVPGATYYIVQFKPVTSKSFNSQQYLKTLNESLSNFQNPAGPFCDAVDLRVATVNPGGVSNFSKIRKVDAPTPAASPKLELKEMTYLNKPFVSDFYQANGTVRIVFRYELGAWPLGDGDLEVEPMFHMINCQDPDLSQSVPLPEFVPGPDNTVVGEVGSDMMYRKCRFVYYVQSVASKQCKTTSFIHSPPTDSLQTLNINCDTVANNPCVYVPRYDPPLCGQVEDVHYAVTNDHVNAKDKDFKLFLNISFEPMVPQKSELPTLYYVAFYGEAVNYKSKEEETFLGVNITKVLGNVSNCYEFTKEGYCAHPTEDIVYLNTTHLDELYGITFCAVKSTQNLTFPDFTTINSRAMKPKADKIFVSSKVYILTNNGLGIFINTHVVHSINKREITRIKRGTSLRNRKLRKNERKTAGNNSPGTTTKTSKPSETTTAIKTTCRTTLTASTGSRNKSSSIPSTSTSSSASTSNHRWNVTSNATKIHKVSAFSTTNSTHILASTATTPSKKPASTTSVGENKKIPHSSYPQNQTATVPATTPGMPTTKTTSPVATTNASSYTSTHPREPKTSKTTHLASQSNRPSIPKTKATTINPITKQNNKDTSTNTLQKISRNFESKKTGVIIGAVVGGAAAVVLCILLIWLYFHRKMKRQQTRMKLHHQQELQKKDERYTDMPKKKDIWEIERRNLIIHSNKLGSGAFGAVYSGKLLGKSLGHKDANSPLGVNLMRAENCEVAVKMLPEYTDELSKSEFLREIGLMKTLGYHERLVNMLACITESEPLCLVVEYCSDGDLLHFLRERCKYMMKLDEMGVPYHDPPVDDNYELEMIITMKQLLMFAVQICYGLEYLSQKGFVHRDVAARNILVHDRNSCKIGDFGLCRYIYADAAHYKSKGGRLPLKWMSPEAIRHYEFSTQSDVWSFGILLFEIITLGGSPYPGVQPEDMLPFLEQNGRMEQPDNCPDDYYSVMSSCWESEPERRLEFSTIRQRLASQLEEVTEEYSYLKLDAQRDYYNVQYGDQKPDVIIIPETACLVGGERRFNNSSSTISINSIQLDSLIIDHDDDIARTKAAIKEENSRNESLAMTDVTDV